MPSGIAAERRVPHESFKQINMNNVKTIENTRIQILSSRNL